MNSLLPPKFRVASLLLVANATWIFISWTWFERSSWMWITPIALSINFVLVTYDYILNFVEIETHPLLGQDPWGVLKIVHQCSTQIGVPTPKVHLLESDSAQIFVYGRSKKTTRLVISEGLLEVLNGEELKAVIIYQLVGIRGSYNVLNYWAAGVVDLFIRLGLGIEKAIAIVLGWSPSLAGILAKPWLWLVHHVLFSRQDFKKLDKSAAQVLENPRALATALYKMDSYSRTRPLHFSWVIAHMCMVNPLPAAVPFDFLQIQPNLQSRIRELVGHYPL